MRIIVEAERVGHDPAITIYKVEVRHSGQVWPETFGSDHDLRIFLRGLQVAYNLTSGDFLILPEIPPYPGMGSRVES